MSKTLQHTLQPMPGGYSGSSVLPEISQHEQADLREQSPLNPEVFPVPVEIGAVHHRTIRGTLPLVERESPELTRYALCVAERAQVVSGGICALRHLAAQSARGGQYAA